MFEYRSEIQIGATYKDTLSGFQGVAVYVSFNITGCERVALDNLDGNEIKAYEFDATRLKFVKGPTADVKKLVKAVEVAAPGGPTSRSRRV